MFLSNNSSKCQPLQGHLVIFVWIVSAFSLFLLNIAKPVYAQSYRYMDSSGNVIFVDRPEKVPPQYRNQVPALVTPLVRLDEKQARKLEQEQKRKKKDLEFKKVQEERKKELALRRKQKEQEKAMRKNKGKKQAGDQELPAESQEGDFSQVPEGQQVEALPAE